MMFVRLLFILEGKLVRSEKREKSVNVWTNLWPLTCASHTGHLVVINIDDDFFKFQAFSSKRLKNHELKIKLHLF